MRSLLGCSRMYARGSSAISVRERERVSYSQTSQSDDDLKPEDSSLGEPMWDDR